MYIDVLYPDNTTKEVDCTRTGNVWVGTFEGSTLAGRVTQGYQIKADGVDENENPITGYVLGCGDVYILDDTNDIKALVGKTAMRYLDDIPSTPTKGDVVIVNGALKIYDGGEWYTVEVDLSNYYTKSEIDEKVAEIDSSISALGDEIPTKTSDLENDSGFLTSTSTTITDIQDDVDAVENSLSEVESTVSELNTTVGQIQNDVSALDSSMTELESSMTSLESSMSELESSLSELDSTVSELDGLAVKYADDEKINVVLNQQGLPMTLQINDATNVGDARIIFGSTNRNHISKNSLTIGVPENGETAQHMGDTQVTLGGTQNDAYVLIGQGVTLFSSKEKGKTKMFMDDDRIFVTTPATVEEGQTLKAIKVANEAAMSGRSAKKAGEMTKRDEPSLRDEPQDWHWEYVSADLPSKTSDLTNDSGFVNSTYVDQNAKSAWRTWEYEPDATSLTFTAEEANSTVLLRGEGNAPSVSLEYSTDGTTWSDFIVGTTNVTLPNIGDKMHLRAKTTNTTFATGVNVCSHFVMTGKIAASGSIMYLLKNDGDLDTIPTIWCFCKLFDGCASLTAAPELPATTLANNCYY